MADLMHKIDAEKFNNSHKFLAEELLIPNVNKCDGSRINMFCSHIQQAKVLKKSEFPKVFTGRENDVGKYSTSYKRAPQEMEIITEVLKNPDKHSFTSFLLVKYKDGSYDVINKVPITKLTEYFGWENLYNVDLKEGNTIPEGEVIYKSPSYDDHMNFGYGVNLKACYLSDKNLTYEDAIIISESAARKLDSYEIEEIYVTLNNNDILINLYGENGKYKGFPDLGEETKDGVLVSRRRIDYESVLFDLSSKNLKQVNDNIDTTIYGEGKVVDISVFTNTKEFQDSPFNEQLFSYIQDEYTYYSEIYDALAPIVESGNLVYSEDLAYYYDRAKRVISGEENWRFSKTEFDHVVIKFTLLKIAKVGNGNKLSNRYGGKGVISAIYDIAEVRKDSDMPVSASGVRAEILCNPLGVPNRLNIAQLYEHEINFCSDHIVILIKNEPKLDKKIAILVEYLNEINPEYASFTENHIKSLSAKDKKQFMVDVETNGIFVHQPPFYGNISFQQLRNIYEKYNIKKYETFINGKQTEHDLIIADIYMMKLKHVPHSKFSARSSSNTGLKGIPSKSTKYKHHQQPYSKTPIRAGEMELMNLRLCKKAEEIREFVKKNSACEVNRQNGMMTLLTHPNPFNIQKIPEIKTDSCVKMILDAEFAGIGIKLEK